MDKLRFIHTADLHLGGPLNCGGDPPVHLTTLFNEAGYRSLELICDRALEYEVDFVIIAGDIYDREARSVKASRFFVEQCQRLQEENIPVYVISGNHDPLSEKEDPFTPPDNVHIFDSSEVETREYFGKNEKLKAQILGQSYRCKFESRIMYRYFTIDNESVNNI